MARRVVVAAVDDDVGRGDQRVEAGGVGALAQRARRSTSGLMAATACAAESTLRRADAREVVRDLALQVGQVDAVVVDDRDACRRRPMPRKSATGEPSPPAPIDERMRAPQPSLALDADLVEQEVARVAQQLRVAQAVVRSSSIEVPIGRTP